MLRPVLGLAASRTAPTPVSALRRQPLAWDLRPRSCLRAPFLYGGGPSLTPRVLLSTSPWRCLVAGPPRWSDVNRKPFDQNTPPTETTATEDTNTNAAAPAEDPIPIQTTVTPTPPPPTPTPIWQRLGPLTTAAHAYAGAQHRRPWLTQFISALVIYLLADLSAQSFSSTPYDPHRTLRNLIIGGASAIPTYYWFLFLSHNFNYASSRLLSVGVKILINLAVFTPLFNAYFFGAQAFLSTGGDWQAVVDRIVFAVPPSTLNSWKFWPWVTAFNFWCVPLHFRSVFAGVISIGWQTYLAWLNRMAELAAANKARANKAQAEADGEKEEEKGQTVTEDSAGVVEVDAE